MEAQIYSCNTFSKFLNITAKDNRDLIDVRVSPLFLGLVIVDPMKP